MDCVEGLGRYFLTQVLDIVARLLSHAEKVDLYAPHLERYSPSSSFADRDCVGDGADPVAWGRFANCWGIPSDNEHVEPKTPSLGIFARWGWCIIHLRPSPEDIRCSASPEQVMTRMLDTVDPLSAGDRIGGGHSGVSAGRDRVIGSFGGDGRFAFRARLAEEGAMADLARPHLRGTIIPDDQGSTIRYRLSTRGPWVVSLLAGAIGILALLASAVLEATGTVYGVDHHSLATPFLWIGLGLLGMGSFVFLNTTPDLFKQGSYLTAWLSGTFTPQT